MKKQSSSSSGLTTGHSFTSRSMDFSTPATSVDESNRWSDVVPPKTALTFAVVWDPDSDMVAFSGASLLDASPTSFSDASSYARSSTLRWFQDNHEYLFSDDASRLVLGRTQTSSALMDATMFAVEGENRSYSCFDGLGQHTSFDPRTDFAKRWDELLDAANASGDDSDDESFFEVDTRRERLLSGTRLTILTTSFLAISAEDASSTWSALETPTEAHISPGRKRKKLRKPRPNDGPKPPDVVLQRKGYNHAQCKSPRSKSRPQLPKFLSSCRKSKERRRWACIEVTQEIAQHIG